MNAIFQNSRNNDTIRKVTVNKYEIRINNKQKYNKLKN